MKHKIGTLVLFVLLVLTVVALKHINVPEATTVGRVSDVKQVSAN